jgi:hypothetical protein
MAPVAPSDVFMAVGAFAFMLSYLIGGGPRAADGVSYLQWERSGMRDRARGAQA